MPEQGLMLHPASRQLMTLKALASAANMHEEFVERLVSFGLLEPLDRQETALWFDCGEVLRLRKIRRLQNDLGINLAGIAVVLDLLERIEALQSELKRLRNS